MRALISSLLDSLSGDVAVEKRAATIGGIIRRTIKIGLWLIAGVMVLREFNFDIAPLLTGAGIIGLALGFGAQHRCATSSPAC